MKIRILSFSERGAKVAEELVADWEDQQDCLAFCKSSYCKERKTVTAYTGSLQQWCETYFTQSDALIFIGATGIAVRGIAPLLKDKMQDPAVLVIDETKKYVISLLSGHMGGANELCEKIANRLRAIPVITTATDCNQCFAVDTFAKKQGLFLSDKRLAKELSAALLAGKTIGVTSEWPLQGDWPRGLKALKDTTEKECAYGMDITYLDKKNYEIPTLALIPACIVVGIGCKKGKSEEELREALRFICEKYAIHPKAIAKVASIDLKKEEPGLCDFCKNEGYPFVTFDAEKLQSVEGTFSSSQFVKEKTGVDNVCERAALAAAEEGSILVKKEVLQGITISMAVQKWSMDFE